MLRIAICDDEQIHLQTSSVESNSFLMKNQRQVPISRSFPQDAKAAFFETLDLTRLGLKALREQEWSKGESAAKTGE